MTADVLCLPDEIPVTEERLRVVELLCSEQRTAAQLSGAAPS
ncbi:hypothetical protein [Candidatus Poriferisodalis sp.]